MLYERIIRAIEEVEKTRMMISKLGLQEHELDKENFKETEKQVWILVEVWTNEILNLDMKEHIQQNGVQREEGGGR